MSTENDRVILHTSAHEGGVMIDWQGARDDYPRGAGWSAEIERSGALAMRFNRPDDDLPMCLVIGPTANDGVKVYVTEDGVSDQRPGTPIIFDSATVEDPETVRTQTLDIERLAQRAANGYVPQSGREVQALVEQASTLLETVAQAFHNLARNADEDGAKEASYWSGTFGFMVNAATTYAEGAGEQFANLNGEND